MSQLARRVLSAVLVLSSSAPALAQVSPEVIARGKKGTARVSVYGVRRASAFCIDPSGLFLTSAHVLDEVIHRKAPLDLIIDDGLATERAVPAQVVRHDDNLDLALVQIEPVVARPDVNNVGRAPGATAEKTKEPALTPLELATDVDTIELADVAAFGAPSTPEIAAGQNQNPPIAASPSHITSLRKDRGRLLSIQIDSQLGQGYSGGPVVDSAGKVIGMVATMVKGAALNLAIPAGLIREFLSAPALIFDPPVMTPREADRPVTWSIELRPTAAGASLPDNLSVMVTLEDGPGTSRRFAAQPAGDGKFQVTLTPLSPDREKKVELDVRNGDRVGDFKFSTKDKEVTVGRTKLKLSELRLIVGGMKPRVETTRGTTIDGMMADRWMVKVRLPRWDQLTDLRDAEQISVRAVPVPVAEVVSFVEVKQGQKVLVAVRKRTAVDPGARLMNMMEPSTPMPAFPPASNTSLPSMASRVPATPNRSVLPRPASDGGVANPGGSLSPAQAFGQITPEAIDRGKGGTARVIVAGMRPTASAFCIDPAGLFLTNAHVLEAAIYYRRGIVLIIDGGLATQRVVPAQVVRHDDSLDLALVQTEPPVTRPEVYAYDGIRGLHKQPAEKPKELALTPLNVATDEVIGMVATTADGTAPDLAIPVGLIREFLEAPAVIFDPPAMSPAEAVRAVTWTITLQPPAPGARLPEDLSVAVTLEDGPGKSRRFAAKQAGDGKFKVTLSPLSPDREPETEQKSVVPLFPMQEVVSFVEVKRNDKVLVAVRKRTPVDPNAWMMRNLDGTSPTNQFPPASNPSIPSMASRYLATTPSRPVAPRPAGIDGVTNLGDFMEVDGVPRGAGKAIRPPAIAVPAARLTSEVPADAQEPLSRRTESTIADVTVGGAGRYVLLTLAGGKKLAVFDVNAAAIVKTISFSSGNAMVAAGANKFLVALPDQRRFERWSLSTLERDGDSVPWPFDGEVKAVAMGSGSDGPALLLWENPPPPGSPATGQSNKQCSFVDVNTLSVRKFTGGPFDGERKPPPVSASGARFGLPNVTQVPQPREPIEPKPVTASVHLASDGSPLVTVYGLDEMAGNPTIEDWFPDGVATDQRFHFVPAAKLLITIPPTNDRLVLRRIDLDQSFDKSRGDRLIVTSAPNLDVWAGENLVHRIVARSKKGGITYALARGPGGLKVISDGQITWTTPTAIRGEEVTVVITVGDNSGDELFHTLKIRVK